MNQTPEVSEVLLTGWLRLKIKLKIDFLKENALAVFLTNILTCTGRGLFSRKFPFKAKMHFGTTPRI